MKISFSKNNPFTNARNNKKPLLLDGAMGSLLQQKNLTTQGSLWSAIANIENQNEVLLLHKTYIEAGADIITTNTFRTNPYTYLKSGFKDISSSALKAVELAKTARNKKCVLIAGSNPPIEDCYQRARTVSQKDLEWNHSIHIDILHKAGCDFILNETQSHMDEISFITEYCFKNSIPFIVSLFIDNNTKLLSGENLNDAINFITKYNPLAVGINCVSFEVFKEALISIDINLNWGFYLNCGIGQIDDKTIKQSISPIDYSEIIKPLLSKRPSFIGSCCGSNPDHTRQLRKLLDG